MKNSEEGKKYANQHIKKHLYSTFERLKRQKGVLKRKKRTL